MQTLRAILGKLGPAPAIGAVHDARPQGAPLDIAELVESGLPRCRDPAASCASGKKAGIIDPDWQVDCRTKQGLFSTRPGRDFALPALP